MDRLEAMSVFVRAVEAGSLSAAARSLGMPLPSVSRKVGELESHLKAVLVTRARTGLKLTQAGQTFFASAKEILEEISAAERSASGEFREPTGELAISAPIVCGRLHLLPVATDFLAANPKIDLCLQLSDRLINLTDEHIDCALRIGVLPDSALTAVNVGAVRRLICASPAYLKKAPHLKTPEDLAKHACITAEALGARDTWRVGDGKGQVSVTVHSRLVVNTSEAAIDAAISNCGLVQAFSYQVAAHVKEGRLDVVLEKYESARWPIHLLYKPWSRLPIKLRAFLDYATPRLRQRLTAVSL